MAILSRPDVQPSCLHRPVAATTAGKISKVAMERHMHIRQELLIAAQCSALHKGRYFSWKETLPPLARPRPSSCGKLPLELLGLIFSHLSDDKPALSACSLVNRAWFYASRAHLFRTLEVSWISLANMVRWKRAYMPAGDESWDRYSRRCRAQLGRAPLACALLCFLEEAGELIGASIRELRLVGWQHDTCLLSVDDVDALIRRLPLLTKLSLTRATLRWSGQGLPAGRHPLRTLEVHDCLVSGSSAFALLTLFPAVETLLWDASDDLDEDDVDGALLADLLGPFEMPRLAAFDAGRSLYPHHAPEATALLVQGMCMRGVPAVASLELDILMDSFDADSLLTLFEDVGPNLLSLRMELGCIFPTRVSTPAALGLDNCTGLHELELGLPSYWMPDVLQLVPALLADLWAGRDKSAGLSLVLRFDATFTKFDALQILNHELTRYLKRGLSAVTIRRSRRSLDEQERLAAIQALGSIHATHALRF